MPTIANMGNVIRARFDAFCLLCNGEITKGTDLVAPLDRGTQLPSGRVLRITSELLIRGSCGIPRPLTEPKRLRGYVRQDRIGRLRDCLEADARALFAYHHYGRLHGAVRLRAGRRTWWLTLTSRAVAGDCAQCRRPLERAVQLTGGGVVCVTCASRSVVSDHARLQRPAA